MSMEDFKLFKNNFYNNEQPTKMELGIYKYTIAVLLISETNEMIQYELNRMMRAIETLEQCGAVVDG